MPQDHSPQETLSLGAHLKDSLRGSTFNLIGPAFSNLNYVLAQNVNRKYNIAALIQHENRTRNSDRLSTLVIAGAYDLFINKSLVSLVCRYPLGITEHVKKSTSTVPARL